MRGWRYIGTILAIDGDEIMFRTGDEIPVIPRGSIIGVSPHREGPLRAGLTKLGGGSRWDIPAMCEGDHVFVATAIGEDAFRS